MELNFNARTVKPDEGRMGPVPTGWYEAMIVSDETKPNSAGTGEYLNLVFDVVTAGPFKGSKIFHMLNLRNPSDKAMEIAYGQLSAIAHAVNTLDVRNSSDLHNKVLKINVKLDPAELEADGVTIKYEAKNRITAFKDSRTETPPSPTAHVPVAAKAAAAKPAWQPGAAAPAPANAAPWAGQNQAPAQAPAQAPWNTPQGGQPPVPQGYAPPPQQQQPPAQPPAQAPAPAWQAPANAQPQPWAQQPQGQQAQPPAGPPMAQPAPTPQPWTPPVVQGQPQQGGAPVPPWAQQPQGPAQ